MESLENSILKLNPDTVMTIRKMYNLDKPGDMDKAIDALAEWLKKQQHLTKKEYPREYLERSIILRKGSVEKAKSHIDMLCSLRTIFPKYFEKYHAINDFNNMDHMYYHAFLPRLTEDHYRVYVAKFFNNDITADIIFEIYRLVVLKIEYSILHDYCNGFVAVVDYRDINFMEFIIRIDFIALHNSLTILLEGYGLRIKGVHLITSSKAIEVLLKMVKPLLGPKVAKRLHVHKDIETLYEHLSREVLPSDLGGYEKSLASLSEQWRNLLGTEENVNYMREMSKAVSNEAYRLREKLNGLDLGLAGTFRTLNVD